jgi:hypothetical protein
VSRVSTSLLMWLGLLAAPMAWTAQHVAGIGLTLADCAAVGPVRLSTWTVIVSALAVATAATGLAAAVATLRRTRDAGPEPPGSRIHFLAIVALTVTPLLLAIMLMSSIGDLSALGCRQS